MSVIGPGSLGSLNLAGSLAGAQRNAAADGELKQTAADRKSQIDRNEATARALEDVGETESTPERDADGRMPFGHEDDEFAESPEQELAESEKTKKIANRRSVDAFGERGGALDLDA